MASSGSVDKKYSESFQGLSESRHSLVAAASELIEEAACKDLHALVQMLHNPHQDIPLVAILRRLLSSDDQARPGSASITAREVSGLP